MSVAQQTATTTTLDPSQTYATGNIVQMTTTTSGSTWVNGVYQDQLTCWAWGNPGNCGPNPTVRPGNMINYSFGMTDLYQVQSIANVLPNSGTGLRINGYNFGFMAKNGNGWDDGRQDYLTAYVAFYGTDGKVKDYTNYDLNSKFNWTRFDYSKDFISPYPAKELSTVRYGFVGMDNNFWAGPYGPEIYDISFSLKYSVDPCATNVLSNPTCPGYMDALNKLLPPPPTVDNTTTSSTTTATTSVTTTVVADPVSPTVTVTSTPTTSTNSPSQTTSNTTSSSTTSTSSSANTTTATTSSTPTKEGSSSQGSGTSLGLSVVAKNQQREQAIATQAVQNATSTASSAAQQSQQEAMSIASQAAANSTTSAATVNQSMSNGTGIKTTSSSSTGLSLPGMTPDNVSGQGSQQITNSGNIINSQQEFRQIYNPMSIQSSMLSSMTDNTVTSPSDFLTNRTNPLNEVIEAKQNVPQTNSVQPIGSSVNRNVTDNDVAGGVSISRMAVAPTGYGDYLNFTLKDSAFYAPKEIYKNQRNVDNARALRQLTNDSRHQEMVEQQYRR